MHELLTGLCDQLVDHGHGLRFSLCNISTLTKSISVLLQLQEEKLKSHKLTFSPRSPLLPDRPCKAKDK